MTTDARFQKIAATLATWPRDYDHGVRVEGTEIAIGTELPPSRVWDDGECTDEVLPGTSTIGTTERVEFAAERLRGYCGDWLVLCAGVDVGHGEDVGESILRDAVVEACVYIGE